jgi:hypothetical protein
MCTQNPITVVIDKISIYLAGHNSQDHFLGGKFLVLFYAKAKHNTGKKGVIVVTKEGETRVEFLSRRILQILSFTSLSPKITSTKPPLPLRISKIPPYIVDIFNKVNQIRGRNKSISCRTINVQLHSHHYPT